MEAGESARDFDRATLLASVEELAKSIAHDVNQPLGAVLMTASAGSVAALTPIQPTSPVAGLLLSYHFGFLFNTDFRDTTVLAGINLVALSFAARLWRIRSLVTPHSSAQGVHESPAA